MTVSSAVSRVHPAHSRPAIFGQLNSAIVRGDLAAAKAAFFAIAESDSSAALAKKPLGAMEAIGTAIASGDIEAARKSLADFRSARMREAEATPQHVIEPAPAASSSPSSGSGVPTGTAQIETRTIDQIARLLAGTGSTLDVSA